MEKEKNKLHATHHTFCQNDKNYEVMKSNLPAEDKRMHKFTKVASGQKKKTNFMSLTTLFEVMKSNLPPEHKRLHKFTKIASG